MKRDFWLPELRIRYRIPVETYVLAGTIDENGTLAMNSKNISYFTYRNIKNDNSGAGCLLIHKSEHAIAGIEKENSL